MSATVRPEMICQGNRLTSASDGKTVRDLGRALHTSWKTIVPEKLSHRSESAEPHVWTEAWDDHLHREALRFPQGSQTPEHAALHDGSGRRRPEEGGGHPGGQWVRPGRRITTRVRRLESLGASLRKAVSLSP